MWNLPVGKVALTVLGKELATLCTVKDDPEFRDYVLAELAKRDVDIEEINVTESRV